MMSPEMPESQLDASGSSNADVLIIGGSHAGLSAALTLYRALYTSIIFDTQEPCNDRCTPTRLTPTWENKTTDEMREACRKELLATGLATFVNTRVKTIEKISDGQFEVVDHADKHWVGKKVLLSYGAREVFPDLPGYLDLYTRRIFPCMFQFGYELRGSPSGGLLAIDGLANLQHAALLTLDGHRFADKMTIYTNGDQILFESLRNRFLGTTSIHLDDRKITHVGQDTETSQVVINFEVGAKCLESFLIHRPKITIDQNLPSQLKIKPSESGGIQVAPPFYGTNVRGVYAAGDCASPMKTITNAMTMGSYAACGLSRELQTDKY